MNPDSEGFLLWVRLGRIGTLDGDVAVSAWWWRRIVAAWLIASLLVVAVVESAAAALDGTNYWERKGYARGQPSWCEASGPHAYNRTAALFIRESSNARSDYSYVSVGIGLIVLGAADMLADRKHLSQTRRQFLCSILEQRQREFLAIFKERELHPYS